MRMITFEEAQRYEELLQGDAVASAYDYGSLFAGSGWWAKRRARARFKLLKRIDPKLRRLLREEERVVFVCTGSVACLEERFFAGHFLAYYVNLRALVFTTRRVLLLHVGQNGRPRELVSELLYASVESLRSTWNGLLVIKLINGREHRFSKIRRVDREFLDTFIKGVTASTRMPFALDPCSDGLRHLCPYCFTAQQGWPLTCSHCHGPFKSARQAVWRSLAFPGVGNLYLGHRLFAFAEIIVALAFWWVFVMKPLRYEAWHYNDPSLGRGFWLFVLAIIVGMHSISAMVSYYFARKGIHPKKALDDNGPR